MILYRYIVRKHILPFTYAFAVIIFVLMMNLAVRLLNKIISKGLEPMVVVELFLIQMGWIVALAVPMAALVATLMTFGSMSGDNEIVAIKASGRSLYTLLIPVMSAASILALLLVFFNNLILPEANHRLASLSSDISRKKPTAFIEPQVLIRDFPNYVLYVDQVNPRSGLLQGVKIFSNAPGEDPSTTVADSGRIRVTTEGNYLQLTLYNGESHSVDRDSVEAHFLGRFDRQVLFIRNIDAEFRRTDRSYRSDREKSAQRMLEEVAQHRTTAQARIDEFGALLDTTKAEVTRLGALLEEHPPGDSGSAFDTIQDMAGWIAHFQHTRQQAVSNVQRRASRAARIRQQLRIQKIKISQYLVEVHKKYSIPVTTLVFVLVGAPLGIMAKRGGLAVGASYSIFFFVIFWMFLIGGEAMADRLLIHPIVAMWAGNVFVGICGIILVVRMVRETTFISFGPLVHAWKRLVSMFRTGTQAPVVAPTLRVVRAVIGAPLYVARRVTGILPMYLIRKFIAYLIGILLALVVVFIVIDYFSNLRRFDGAPLLNVALYYWYWSPFIILTVLPIIVLMASMGAIGVLAKGSELTAMKAAGISLQQLALPLLFLGIILAAGSFYIGELVLPDANYKRNQFEENIKSARHLHKTGTERKHREFKRNFFYFGNEQTLYRFGEFSTHPHHTKDVWRETYEGNRIAKRVQARSLHYDDGDWLYIDGVVRTFYTDSSTLVQFDTLPDTVLSATPNEMIADLKDKEEMSYWELASFIEKLKHRGEKVSTHMADLHFKIALPTMNFIVMLLGISITARAGRKGGAALFGAGLILTFAYWIMAQFSLAFARNGQIPPLAGAWLSNACFLLLGLVLFRRAMR